MRPLLLCVFAACLLVLSGCGGDDDGGNDANSPATSGAPSDPPALARDLSDRTFVAGDVDGHDLVTGSQITLSFPSPAALSADAGCNTISGGFELDGSTLVAADLASTLKGCSDELQAQDAWLSAFLTSRPTAALHDRTLTLTGNDATITFHERS
jgi:heat shock protein HslJ